MHNRIDEQSRTFVQPGVKAPGTPKIITFFPFTASAMLTLSPGVPSNKSMLGSFAPTYNISRNNCFFNNCSPSVNTKITYTFIRTWIGMLRNTEE